MLGVQRCAGTAFSSLAEQPLQSDSSVTPDSSSEPSYWSAEENSPSAASSGSLARAVAADRGPERLGAGANAGAAADTSSSAPPLGGSHGGSRDGSAQRPPATAHAASQRSLQVDMPARVEADLEPPPAPLAAEPEAAAQVSPFKLQQHLAQQLLQRQQAGLFPQEVPPQPPQTPPWRAVLPGGEANQPSPSLPPAPLSTAHQPSGSATRSASILACPKHVVATLTPPAPGVAAL